MMTVDASVDLINAETEDNKYLYMELDIIGYWAASHLSVSCNSSPSGFKPTHQCGIYVYFKQILIPTPPFSTPFLHHK